MELKEEDEVAGSGSKMGKERRREERRRRGGS